MSELVDINIYIYIFKERELDKIIIKLVSKITKTVKNYVLNKFNKDSKLVNIDIERELVS